MTIELCAIDNDDGGHTAEFVHGERSVTLVQHDDEGEPMYYVARKEGFRSAGVVLEPRGLANLMVFLDTGTLLTGGLEVG